MFATSKEGADNMSVLKIKNGSGQFEPVLCIDPTPAIADWLDDHPEATTTVEDGAVSTAKLADGSVTHAKLANNAVGTDNIIDKAVTLEKTDFFYKLSKKFSPDWLSRPSNYYAVSRRRGTAMATVAEEWPEVLSIVVPFTISATPYYLDTNAIYRITVSTGAYDVHTEDIAHTTSEIVIGDKHYKVIKITQEDFLTAYTAAYEYDNPSYDWGSSAQPAIRIGGGGSNITQSWANSVVIDGEVDASLISHGYKVNVLSADFVEGVHAALSSEDEGLDDKEAAAKLILNGKVMIALGDSYTVQMDGQLQTLATKYGMVLDNRGITSSSICGSYDSSTGNGTGYKPMWKRANTIVSQYTSGYTIDETSYSATDVGLVLFMGGANDGFGLDTWVGRSIADTDTNHIYGACNHIFNKLLKTFTKAKMICITQPSSYSRTIPANVSDATAQVYGFANAAALNVLDDIQFSNYAMAVKEEAVKNTAWAYQIPVLDMFLEYPTVLNPDNRSAYWNSDKLHLNAAGYGLIRKALDKKIAEVVGGD